MELNCLGKFHHRHFLRSFAFSFKLKPVSYRIQTLTSWRSEFRLIGLILGYLLISWAARLIFATFVTYFFLNNRGSGSLNDIGDIIRSNQILTSGIASLLYVLVLQAFHPITTTQWRQIFPIRSLNESFTKNLATGAMIALAFIAGNSWGGHLGYLGIYIQFDEIVPSLLSLAFFTASIFMVSLLEEFIVRAQFEAFLSKKYGPTHGPLIGNIGAMLLYLGIKSSQFDLDFMQALNVALLSLCLSNVFRITKSSVSSAGFAVGLFTSLHSICSLPFFGQDVSGVFLIRTTPDLGSGQWLSGGTAGPEGAVVLAILLSAYLINSFFKMGIRSKN